MPVAPKLASQRQQLANPNSEKTVRLMMTPTQHKKGIGQTLLAPLGRRLGPQWQHLKGSINSNPRLQAGVLGIVLMGLGWGLLNINDHLTAQQKQLTGLLEEKRKIERQVGNNARMKRLQEQLLITQEEISKGLRTAPTAVIAQADFGDWLNNGLVDAGVKQLKVNQAVYHFLTESSETTGNDSSKSCSGAACSLVELQTQIRFGFEAISLAKALAFLEGAEKRLTIEQLSINLGERQVEMTVKTLAHITNDLDREGLQQEMLEQARNSGLETQEQTSATTDKVTPAKKQVEIKW